MKQNLATNTGYKLKLDFLVYGMKISLVQPNVSLIRLTFSSPQPMDNNTHFDDTIMFLRTLMSKSLFFISAIFMPFPYYVAL